MFLLLSAVLVPALAQAGPAGACTNASDAKGQGLLHAGSRRGECLGRENPGAEQVRDGREKEASVRPRRREIQAQEAERKEKKSEPRRTKQGRASQEPGAPQHLLEARKDHRGGLRKRALEEAQAAIEAHKNGPSPGRKKAPEGAGLRKRSSTSRSRCRSSSGREISNTEIRDQEPERAGSRPRRGKSASSTPSTTRTKRRYVELTAAKKSSSGARMACA